MFESKHQPLATFPKFILRMMRYILIGVIIILITLFIGTIGLLLSEHSSWLDSFVNSAMIISGVGTLTPIVTKTGKMFSSIYALTGNIIFISVIGIIFSPVIHRFFHKFHLDA